MQYLRHSVGLFKWEMGPSQGPLPTQNTTEIRRTGFDPSIPVSEWSCFQILTISQDEYLKSPVCRSQLARSFPWFVLAIFNRLAQLHCFHKYAFVCSGYGGMRRLKRKLKGGTRLLMSTLPSRGAPCFSQRRL
jgi:hypothetical protein